MDLVAIEELSQLKCRYLRALDTKDWDAFGETLTDDVTADYGERLAFTGREAVLTYMRSALTAQIVTVHHVHQREITVDGDRATGSWALDDTVIAGRYNRLLRGAAYYEDRYRRSADGRWRIAHTSYRRLYQAVVDLADVPSWTLSDTHRVAPTR